MKTFDHEAAAQSAAEFAAKITPNMTVAQLANLWRAHYLTTGHKQLGRVILSFAAAAAQQPVTLEPAE